jgi:hypothetical protein
MQIIMDCLEIIMGSKKMRPAFFHYTREGKNYCMFLGYVRGKVLPKLGCEVAEQFGVANGNWYVSRTHIRKG